MTEQSSQAPASPATAPAGTDAQTILLATPIRRGETEIAELELRKPKAGNLRGLDVQDLITGDVNALLTLLPRICVPQIITQEAEQLDMADLAQVAGAVRGFFMSKSEWEALQKYLGTGEAEGSSTS